MIFMRVIMPPPRDGGIKQCRLTTSVMYIVNIHGTHRYWKLGALGAAGQA